MYSHIAVCKLLCLSNRPKHYITIGPNIIIEFLQTRYKIYE